MAGNIVSIDIATIAFSKATSTMNSKPFDRVFGITKESRRETSPFFDLNPPECRPLIVIPNRHARPFGGHPRHVFSTHPVIASLRSDPADIWRRARDRGNKR
jgi:hypothetical protein